MKRLSYSLLLICLCLAGMGQSITVTVPNGGEVWKNGTTQSITWTSTGVSLVNLEYSEDNGITWNLMAANQTNSGSYSWNIGAQPTLKALVRISDSGNNTITDVSDATFIVGPISTVNAGNDTLICFGTAAQLMAAATYYDGAIGPPPPPPTFTYAWSPVTALSSATIANPVASPTVTTVYTVTVDDGAGHTAVDSIKVTVDHPVASFSNIQNATCNGTATGSLCSNLTGGMAPYAYLWSNLATVPCPGGLVAGNYGLTITDNAGCTTSVSTNLTQPPLLTASITNIQGPSCNGANNGSLCASVSGGTPGYTYNWNMGQTISCPVFLSAGTYVVTITDVNACTVTVSGTISAPPVLSVAVTGLQNVSCFGGSDGSVCGVANGGTGGITYLWSNGSVTVCQNGLSAASYFVTALDANNCSASAAAVISQPTQLSSALNASPVLCHGDSSDVCATANGGVSPYQFVWSVGAVFGCPRLPAGTYSVTITDANGCISSASVAVNAPALVKIDAIQADSATCNGLSDGGACVTASGGTTPYTFLWNGMFPATGSNCNHSLPTGVIPIRVTDANGCFADSAFIVYEPAVIIIDSIQTVDPLCQAGNDGSICVWAHGGTPYNQPPLQYTFAWSNGYISPNNGFQGCATGLGAASYTVSVIDANNCIITSSPVAITDPPAFDVNPIPSPVLCAGMANGALVLNPVNGASPYQYSVDGGLTFQSSGNFSPLTPGTYYTKAVDAHGCTAFDTLQITEPTPVQVTFTNTGDGLLPDTTCAFVSGGNPPYTYNWAGGNSIGSGCFEVTAGQFNLSVTDANGCLNWDSVNLNCTGICVWPGDADYDGLANNNDLLAIGLGFGSAGTARVQQDNNWFGHAAQDWASNLPSGSNFKHIDCDGNGSINNDDTLAITLNYSLTHPRNGIEEPRGGVPQFRIQLVPDTLIDGQTVIAHLLLGDSLMNATNVYGLAFTFHYDPLVVDSNEVSLSYNNSSWLCSSAADHLDIDHKFNATGAIETALTRIDHTNRSGGGEIGSVAMKITTGNINGKNLGYYGMLCYISDLVVIDNQGNHQLIDAIADSTEIEFEPNGLHDLEQPFALHLFPNPALNQLTIVSAEKPLDKIAVVDALGEVVLQLAISPTHQLHLDISSLAAGPYCLRTTAGTVVANARFIKLK